MSALATSAPLQNQALSDRNQNKYSSPVKARELLRRHILQQLSSKDQRGFSVLELVVVVGVLGALATISVLNIVGQTKYAQLDEAKALLNSAAAECLQRVRTNPDDYQTWQPDALKSREMKGIIQLPGNYQYKQTLDTSTNIMTIKNTCEEVSIHDPSDESSLLMDLKFSVIGGKIIKEAVNKNNETESACISWGNCGGSESATYLKACNKTKDTCNSNLSKVKSTGPNGAMGYKWVGQCTWPKASPLPSCTDDCWVFNGSCYSKEEDYTAADNANKAQQCIDYETSLKEAGFDGEDLNGTTNECEKNYWYCKKPDEDLSTRVNNKSDYDKCTCTHQLDTWLDEGGDGELPLSSSNCAAAYKCSGREVDGFTYNTTCGNACNKEKAAFLAKGGKGILSASSSSCTSDIYMCDGVAVDEKRYNETCGAEQTCCENQGSWFCSYSGYEESDGCWLNDDGSKCRDGEGDVITELCS